MQQSEYDPGIVAFGGGSSASVIHPVVLGALGLLIVLIFVLKRKYIVVPLLLGLLVIPNGQNLYISGFHLYTFRILILTGLIRAVFSSRSEGDGFFSGGFTVLDKVFLAWGLTRAIATMLLYQRLGVVINQVGFWWDALGAYFLFRSLIGDEEDVVRAVKTLVFVALISTAGGIYEQVKGQNLFGFLGGIRAIPEDRLGRIRSQGVFAHALTSGAFASTVFFLFLWLFKKTKSWLLPALGMLCCLIMAVTAATSTPLAALIGGVFALCLWPIRDHMRVVRWGIVVAILALNAVMKAPVWFLIAHIDLSGGSTGSHRAYLIDNFIRHFSSWWLIGTQDYVNWGYYMYDQCNQFILEGENGGLIAFVCFVALFCICFRWIGNARKKVRGDRDREWQFWILGAVLFAQFMAYFGVDYFDQMKAVWFLILAMITASTQSVLKASTELVPQPADAAPIRKPWLEGKAGSPPQPVKNFRTLLTERANVKKVRSFLPQGATKR
jgi:hypothetical protein